MKTSIDLPANLVDVLQHRAAKSQSSVEDEVIEVLKGALALDLSGGSESSVKALDATARRVQLPLIRSSHPGTLRSLTGAQIDDLLA